MVLRNLRNLGFSVCLFTLAGTCVLGAEGDAPAEAKTENKTVTQTPKKDTPNSDTEAKPKKKGGFKAAYLLPFGVGEFMNGEVLWGSLVGGTQVAGFGMGIAYYLKSKQTLTTGQDTVNQRDVEVTSYTDPTEAADFQAATDDYAAQVQTQYNHEYLMMQVGFGVFAAGWALGITKALFAGSASAPKKKKSKKASQPSAMNEETEELEEWQARHISPKWDLNIQPVRVASSKGAGNSNAMLLDLSVHF